VVRVGLNLGYIFSSCDGIKKIALTWYFTPGHKSKILMNQSANVFLTKNGVAKLGDMNVSKVVRK